MWAITLIPRAPVATRTLDLCRIGTQNSSFVYLRSCIRLLTLTSVSLHPIPSFNSHA